MIMLILEKIQCLDLALEYAKSMMALAEVHIAAYTDHQLTGKLAQQTF